ncbi:hypothetical protein PUNSTDRAFT_53988 [Punctularia strigosozonata HHB-11173 SS5]|uniref:uncharacterized protein n=1 Tax=Punctularia strigosozonata (strain HHB-11173) TaxID=741275 RepID=UPI0004417DF8|nr:uncharacterized protein PUNSTDRAFT_53988 [Punctularia strigosozonata HHB-11173 SS5]EIN06558.1 hypothetical protein PUNSTDRAFT_53988 [Punctularia strigosozonata HHB-11173 SS5]
MAIVRIWKVFKIVGFGPAPPTRDVPLLPATMFDPCSLLDEFPSVWLACSTGPCMRHRPTPSTSKALFSGGSQLVPNSRRSYASQLRKGRERP